MPRARLSGQSVTWGPRCDISSGLGRADLDLQGSSFPAGICGAEISDAEIAISYVGIGGGGVGASDCRSYAGGVIRRLADPSGGGKRAGSTVWLPRMQRVLIGLDDTDTPEKGASWTLAHNIAKAVEDEMSRYLSHTIVSSSLFPTGQRTVSASSVNLHRQIPGSLSAGSTSCLRSIPCRTRREWQYSQGSIRPRSSRSPGW